MIRALVLAAGLGTRLRPLTYVRAKAAIPVNGEPLARRVIRWLVSHGYSDLVVNLHHHPASIARVVGDGRDLGARVRYSWEQPLLGSAGGPRHALPLLVDGSEPRFLVVNGDTLTDVDLSGLQAAHERTGAAVTMALIANPRPDKYGGVRVSADGRVVGFSRAGTPGDSFHFIGVQMVEAPVFADLPDGVAAESVNELYPAIIARRPRAIHAFISGASFQDIGTPADCLQTAVDLAAREGDRMAQGARSSVDDSATLRLTAVWDDVVIGPGAELVECIVADGAHVPGGARYERCALLPAACRTAGEGERIEGPLLITPI
jgi:NDP-sugar pyrophosphorylase family protein